MALDFMAANNKQEDVCSTLAYSMMEEEHRALMSLAESSAEYPLLCRFSDYYQDSVVLSGEIAALLHELRALSHFNPGKLPDITAFHQFLLETQAMQRNIYIFCD